jgi:hypothetical protein
LIVHRLKRTISAAKKLRQQCLDWNKRNASLNATFPVVRRQLEDALKRMRSTIIITEGQARLKQAIQIRRYREGKRKNAGKLAKKIIDHNSRNSGISNGKTEIADLALLCERLLAADQADQLADLKDNHLNATLARLEQVFALLEGQNLVAAGAGNALLNDFKVALFGQGIQLERIDQTIAARVGGLFSLCHERLYLRLEQQRLHNEALKLFNAIGSARKRLVDEVEAHANQAALSAEGALHRAWQTMLFVGMVSMGIFLILSARIARTVKNQVSAIEQTNANLKKEIVQREGVEKALRRSEEALRKAKNELEERVEARTADLKMANKRLGAEIAEKERAEEKLRHRSDELSDALENAREAQQIAENERDKSEKMLKEVTEGKRRLEILISDATAREIRMVELKKEVNDLLALLGKEEKYQAPSQVDAFLSTGQAPTTM